MVYFSQCFVLAFVVFFLVSENIYHTIKMGLRFPGYLLAIYMYLLLEIFISAIILIISPTFNYYLFIAPFALMLGPLLLSYVNLTRHIGGNKLITNLTPLMVFVLIALLNILFSNQQALYLILINAVVFLSLLYLVTLYLNYNEKIKESYTVHFITKWVDSINLIFIILFFLFIIFTLNNQEIFSNYYTKYSVSLMLISVGIFVIRNSIKLIKVEIKEYSNKKFTETFRYKKSILSESLLKEYSDRLASLDFVELIGDDKLSLDKVAKLLKISPHHLSQVLSLKYETTFHNYINSLRVTFAKSLLVSNDSLEKVYKKSGFTSKVSFNRNFKKITGFTPSEFRKSSK